jgi:hypothetical protein
MIPSRNSRRMYINRPTRQGSHTVNIFPKAQQYAGAKSRSELDTSRSLAKKDTFILYYLAPIIGAAALILFLF